MDRRSKPARPSSAALIKPATVGARKSSGASVELSSTLKEVGITALWAAVGAAGGWLLRPSSRKATAAMGAVLGAGARVAYKQIKKPPLLLLTPNAISLTAIRDQGERSRGRPRLKLSSDLGYPGWLGALVLFGGVCQTCYLKFLIGRRHTNCNGFTGSTAVKGKVKTVKNYGGDTFRTNRAEWPAPCDNMTISGYPKRWWELIDTSWDEHPRKLIVPQDYGPGDAQAWGSHTAGDPAFLPPKTSAVRVKAGGPLTLQARIPGPIEGSYYRPIAVQDLVKKAFYTNMRTHGKYSEDAQKQLGVEYYKEYKPNERYQGVFTMPSSVKKNSVSHWKDIKEFYAMGYYLVWAAEMWRVQSMCEGTGRKAGGKDLAKVKVTEPPTWWKKHCVSWGVGCASKQRVLNKKTYRKSNKKSYGRGLQPFGPKALVEDPEKMLRLVVTAVPPPGSIPSGTELTGGYIMNWPKGLGLQEFRPSWSWPGGSTEWRRHIITNLRNSDTVNSWWYQGIGIVMVAVMELAAFVVTAETGGAGGGAVAAASGAAIAMFKSMMVTSLEYGSFDYATTLYGLLEAIDIGKGIEGLNLADLADAVDDKVALMEKYWPHVAALIEDYTNKPDWMSSDTLKLLQGM